MKQFPLLLSIFLLLNCGCTTLTIVEDWGKVPSNATIELHTKDGKMCEFDNWKINKDSSVVGSIRVNSYTWTSVTVQANSVVAVYVRDSQASSAMETSITVVGSLAIAAAIVGVI